MLPLRVIRGEYGIRGQGRGPPRGEFLPLEDARSDETVQLSAGIEFLTLRMQY